MRRNLTAIRIFVPIAGGGEMANCSDNLGDRDRNLCDGPRRAPRANWLWRLRAGLMALTAMAVLAPPSAAFAGRRPFFWTYDTEVVPERGAELEMWYTERVFPTAKDQTHVWTAPIVGLTDRLELALPFEWGYWQASKSTQFDWYGAELRWRLSDPDPETAGPLTFLVRGGASRRVRDRDDVQFEANGVAAYEFAGRCKANADIGAVARYSNKELYATYAGGLSCRAIGDLRAGGELFGEIVSHSSAGLKSMTMAGPNIALTHGRFWMAGGVLIGLTANAPTAMSRLIWAIAF